MAEARSWSEHPRDRSGKSALRISKDPRAVEPRRLGWGQAPGVPAVQGGRPDAEADEACREAQREVEGDGTGSGLEHGLVSDQLQGGTRFRSLTIVDVFTREAVAINAGQSLKGEDVARTLSRLKSSCGVPKVLFCDNGSELTSQVMDLWAYRNGVKIDFSEPGKPTDNACVESFDGTLRGSA